MKLTKLEFRCPQCGNVYQDLNEKYLKRTQKNKSWTTKVHCSCGCSFNLTYNCKGKAVTFV